MSFLAENVEGIQSVLLVSCLDRVIRHFKPFLLEAIMCSIYRPSVLPLINFGLIQFSAIQGTKLLSCPS